MNNVDEAIKCLSDLKTKLKTTMRKRKWKIE